MILCAFYGNHVMASSLVYSGVYTKQNTTYMTIGEYKLLDSSLVELKYIEISPSTLNRSLLEEKTSQKWLHNPSYIAEHASQFYFEGTKESPTKLRNNLTSKYGENYQNFRTASCPTGNIFRPKTSIKKVKVGQYSNVGKIFTFTFDDSIHTWMLRNGKYELLAIADHNTKDLVNDMQSVGFISEPAGYLHYTKLKDYYNKDFYEDNGMNNSFHSSEFVHRQQGFSIPFNMKVKGTNIPLGLSDYSKSATAQTPGNFSGLYNGAGDYCHSNYVAHTFLVNQHPDWPNLMSYLTSHIYDNVPGTCLPKSHGPYCYDTEEEKHGHKELMLPVYENGQIIKIVFMEVSPNDGTRYPIVSYGHLEGRDY